MDCGAWGVGFVFSLERQVFYKAREKLNSLYYFGKLRGNLLHVDICSPNQVAVNLLILPLPYVFQNLK